MTPRSRAKTPDVAPEELERVVREAARGAAGLTKTALRKRVPVSYQRPAKHVDAAIDALVRTGAMFLLEESKGALYFEHDPLAHLDGLVRERLSTPRTQRALKAWVGEVAPGYDVAFDGWFKRATNGAVLYEQSPLPRSKAKRFGREPEPVDVAALLSPVIKSLRATLRKLDAKRVPRQRVREVLLAALESSGADRHANGEKDDDRSRFVAALDRLAADDPATALLSIRALRRRLSLDKKAFDDLALDLAHEGVVELHFHDYPASLPDSERAELVVDAKGTHYVGITPRARP